MSEAVAVESNPDWFLGALRTQWGNIRAAHSTHLHGTVIENEVRYKLTCSCRKEPLATHVFPVNLDVDQGYRNEVLSGWSETRVWRHHLNVLLEVGD